MNGPHASEGEGFVNSLMEIILQNLEDEKFGVEQLVEKSGHSHDFVRHQVKVYRQKTISQLISETRLKEALTLLREGNLSVAEIAYKVGFGSPAYFNKCFHEFYGYTPGELKRMVKWQSISPGEGKNGIGLEGVGFRFRVKWDKILLVSAIIITFLFLVSVGYILITGNPIVSPEDNLSPQKLGNEEKSILVLPFRNLSDEDKYSYFSEGLVQDIISRLSSFHEIKVVSHATSDQYKETKLSVPDIAARHKVNFVLDGSVQRNDKMVRIQVQLIDARIDRQIWTGKFEREMTDIFTILNDISRQVTDSLQATVLPEEWKKVSKIPTINANAYNLYLKGRFFWDRRSKEDLEKAIICFQEAVALDNDYALAKAGLADAWFIQSWWGWYLPREKGYEMSKKLVQEALAIDENLAEARAVRGALLGWQERKWEESLQELKKSIELNPLLSDSHQYYAEILQITNQMEEAGREIDIACQLDPTSYLIHSLAAVIHRYRGEQDKALECVKIAKEIDPKVGTFWNAFYIYDQQNKKEPAARELHQALTIDTAFVLDRDTAVAIYEASGREELFRMLIKCEKTKKTPNPSILAYWNARLGLRKETLRYLKESVSAGNPETYRILTIPAYRFLREDPDFIRIIKELRLYPYLEGENKKNP